MAAEHYRVVTKYSDEEQCWIGRVMDCAEHPELDGLEGRDATAAGAEEAAREAVAAKLYPRMRVATRPCSYCGLVEEHKPDCHRA